MDKQQISLKLVLDGLGIPVELDTFPRRLIIQKAIYLAKCACVDLGYHFRWYLHGPYSSGLARDAFDLEAELYGGEPEDLKGWFLDDESKDCLADLRRRLPQEPAKLADTLELRASVHFLIERSGIPASNTKKLKETLHGFNKRYTVEQVEDAVAVLRESKLLARSP